MQQRLVQLDEQLAAARSAEARPAGTRSLARGAAIMTLATAVSRVTGFGRVVVLALSLLAAACGTDTPDVVEGTEDPDAQEGGTLVFGAEQEPANLNPWLTEGNLFWTSVIIGTPLLAGAYTVTPDFQYVPYLLDGEAEVTDDPFSITYKIREEAQWSDGTPITGLEADALEGRIREAGKAYRAAREKHSLRPGDPLPAGSARLVRDGQEAEVAFEVGLRRRSEIG